MAWDFSAVRTPAPFDRRTYETPHAITPFVELLIVDEADRLKTPALEQLRDHYDRSRPRHDPHRHARHRKAPRPLPSSTAGSASSTSTARCPPPS